MALGVGGEGGRRQPAKGRSSGTSYEKARGARAPVGYIEPNSKTEPQAPEV